MTDQPHARPTCAARPATMPDPSDTAASLEYGDPDGYGYHGMLTYTPDGTGVVCHECGQTRKALGQHVTYAHQMTAAEYRRRHGLSTRQGLAAPATAARFSELGRGDAALRALAAHRRPDLAWRSATAEGQTRPQRRAVRQQTGRRSRLGRDLTDEEVRRLAAADTVAQWAAVAWSIVAADATQGSISRATGIKISTVNQRMCRHRRPQAAEGAPETPEHQPRQQR